jgi:hypothetical protein
VVADDDWRLQGQQRYLTNRTLRWATWWEYRPGWDHDHCEFCWAKFGLIDEDGFDHVDGYVTDDDDYHWICPACFADFRERFGWTVVAS